MINQDFLRQIPLFSELSDEQLEFAKLGQERSRRDLLSQRTKSRRNSRHWGETIGLFLDTIRG